MTSIASCPHCGGPLPAKPRKPRSPSKPRKPRSPSKHDDAAKARAQALYRDLQELGGFKAVGERHGIGRERVRQLLRKAERRGWIPNDVNANLVQVAASRGLTKERAVAALFASGTIAGASRILGVTTDTVLRRFPELADLGEEALLAKRAKQKHAYDAKCLERYRGHERRLGYAPNSTWIFDNDSPMYHGVVRRLGGWASFFKRHGIEPHYSTARGSPSHREGCPCKVCAGMRRQSSSSHSGGSAGKSSGS